MQLATDLVKGARGAATYIGLPERSVYALVEKGRLPVIRMGRSLYFRKSELEAAFRSDAA